MKTKEYLVVFIDGREKHIITTANIQCNLKHKTISYDDVLYHNVRSIEFLRDVD